MIMLWMLMMSSINGLSPACARRESFTKIPVWSTSPILPSLGETVTFKDK